MKKFVNVMITLTILLLSARLVLSPPPTPHSIAGYIFMSDGVTQVPLGTSYTINDTDSLDLVKGKTSIPVPGYTGRYTEAINGSDGDTVIVTAWNTTHYGTTQVTLQGAMDNINVTVNESRPPELMIIIIIPSNNTVKNTTYSFNVTANVTALGDSDSTGCNATIIFSKEYVLNLSVGENFTHIVGTVTEGTSVLTTWNVSGMIDGTTNITVQAKCSSDAKNFDQMNSHTVYNITIQDTTPPLVSLELPSNNSWVNPNNPLLFYNVTDFSGIKNCTLYVDAQRNETNTSVQTDISQSFSAQQIPNGNHTWMVSCVDNSSSNNQRNSSTWNVRIDTKAPNVTALSPDDDFVSKNNTVLFKYLVTDENNVANCSLIIDNSIDQVNTSVTESVSQNFTKAFVRGSYTWQVNCTDEAGNTNSSELRTVNITDPDLKVSTPDISFSSDTPVEDQNVTINVTVHNLGDENATNVVVQFLENDPDNNGIQISNTTVNVTADGNASVVAYWIAKIGAYEIFVVVDPPLSTNGSVTEIDETNNEANKSIYIEMWQTFYGDLVGELMLDTTLNDTLVMWSNVTNILGNIYVVDSDSSISWGTLQSIAKNLSNHTQLDDFEDLDRSLNTTQYNDSVNSTYLFQGKVRANQSFMLYDKNITGVPIVNSTNTSNFVTGILWDYDDLSITYYNGTQDVVFVAKVGDELLGAYGTYDYETKIPARLREYIKPNDKNTVTFYTEII